MNREILKRRLKRYCEAEDAILSGQSYSIEGLTLTRANLADVQKMIAQLDNELSKTDPDKKFRPRIRYVVPADGTHRVQSKNILQ